MKITSVHSCQTLQHPGTTKVLRYCYLAPAPPHTHTSSRHSGLISLGCCGTWNLFKTLQVSFTMHQSWSSYDLIVKNLNWTVKAA